MVCRRFFPAYCGAIFFLVLAQWLAQRWGCRWLIFSVGVIKRSVGVLHILYIQSFFNVFIVACIYFGWWGKRRVGGIWGGGGLCVREGTTISLD